MKSSELPFQRLNGKRGFGAGHRAVLHSRLWRWGALAWLFLSVSGSSSLQAQVVTLAINCGGPAYTNATGTVFAADVYYNGGSTYSSGAAISSTTEDALYQTERWGTGTLSYNLPLANGKYEGTLMFAEIYFNSANSRVFNVSLEGAQVITNWDIWAQVGMNAAYNVTNVVTVVDGQSDIAFSAVVNNPKVSAIRVARIETPVLFVVGNATNLEPSDYETSHRPPNIPKVIVVGGRQSCCATFHFGPLTCGRQ